MRGLLAAIITACASSGGAGGPIADPVAAVSSSVRADRVILGDCSVVTAVAVSSRFVFAATTGGLVTFDRFARRWLPPLVPADGFPREIVSALIADPTTDAVWMRTASRWVRAEFLATQPFVTGLPPSDAVRAARPATLENLYAQFPSLRNVQALLTRDADMRTARVTAGARAPERSEVWLGTAGSGLFQVDPIFETSIPRPYGLLSGGAGALARAADGIWVAGVAATSAPHGLTFLSDDLAQVRWVLGRPGSPLDHLRAYRMAVRGSVAWVAASDGVYRVNLRQAADMRHFTFGGATPLTILAREQGSWIGTTNGLVFLPEDSSARDGAGEGANALDGRSIDGREFGAPELEGRRIVTILPVGDTLWLATDQGLYHRAPDGRYAHAGVLFGDPRLERPLIAAAQNDSLLWTLGVDGQLLAANLHSRRVASLPVAQLTVAPGGFMGELNTDIAPLGALGLGAPVTGGSAAMAADAHTIWASGGADVLIISRGSGVTRTLRSPGDLPGSPRDLLLAPGIAWIATPQGVVRLRRLADGSIP